MCLESEAAEGGRLKSPIARLWGAILRFGQNAVRTPGRTHDNHCVTKGLKVSLKPFQRLGVAHVGRSPRPEDPKGRSPVRARIPKATPLVAHRTAPAGAFRSATERSEALSAEIGRNSPASYRRAHFCRRSGVSERNRRRRLLARRGFAYFLFERKKES